MAYCAKCGSMVEDGAGFCPKCGAGQAGAGTGAATGAGAPASAGLASNVAAALAYLWIIAILWLVIEPYNRDRFIRFHSFQALALGVTGIVLNIVLSLIPVIGWILLAPVGLVWLIAWLVCMFKAFSNEWFKLPIIGDWALQQAGPAQ